MLPDLLKKVFTTRDLSNLSPLGGKTNTDVVPFRYTFFGEGGLVKGGVTLMHQTNIYNDFSLRAFSLAPVISPDGVFWWNLSGELLIDFTLNFVEGEQLDSLQGTLTLLDALSPGEHGKWLAGVRSCGCQVSQAKGTWSRREI
ncbi:hypothetical protein [Lyngbya aestuarii]|uniref:hypothetical protein n=1 Tax=Lyngbya aestuarii TaxID=118322 RepID=UPI00403DEE01